MPEIHNIKNKSLFSVNGKYFLFDRCMGPDKEKLLWGKHQVKFHCCLIITPLRMPGIRSPLLTVTPVLSWATGELVLSKNISDSKDAHYFLKETYSIFSTTALAVQLLTNPG